MNNNNKYITDNKFIDYFQVLPLVIGDDLNLPTRSKHCLTSVLPEKLHMIKLTPKNALFSRGKI